MSKETNYNLLIYKTVEDLINSTDGIQIESDCSLDESVSQGIQCVRQGRCFGFSLVDNRTSQVKCMSIPISAVKGRVMYRVYRPATLSLTKYLPQYISWFEASICAKIVNYSLYTEDDKTYIAYTTDKDPNVFRYEITTDSKYLNTINDLIEHICNAFNFPISGFYLVSNIKERGYWQSESEREEGHKDIFISTDFVHRCMK